MKRIITALLAALLLLTLLAGCSGSEEGYIGRDAASAAALADAGFAANEVQRLKADFERDDGLVYYEVSFVAGAMEYEYVIDPNTAAVLHLEVENAYD